MQRLQRPDEFIPAYGPLCRLDPTGFTVLQVDPDRVGKGETGLLYQQGVIEYFFGFTLGKDRTLFHQADPVGDSCGKVEIVGGNNNTDTIVPFEPEYQFLDAFAVQGIQIRSGFIKDHDLWLHSKNTGNGNQPFLPAA